MSSFHDVRFPLAVGFGARGGPERLTEIVELASGREERNTPWAHARRRWDAGPGVRTLDELASLISFFEARRGRLHAFRFRDPVDHKSCPPGDQPSPLDQPVGVGDGETSVFALIKSYGSGGQAYQRRITHPVAETVTLAVDGVLTQVELDDTGRVVFETPPAAGSVLTAGYEFDVPVRFDTDRLEVSLEAYDAGEVASVPLVEVRLSDWTSEGG